MSFNKLNNCILFSPRSDEPSDLKIIFGCGIVTAFAINGITAQNTPHSEKDPDQNSVIVDTAQRVLRTGRTEIAGVRGKMPLIKEDHPHAQHFSVRTEYRTAQNADILRCDFKYVQFQSIFPFLGSPRCLCGTRHRNTFPPLSE